MQLDKLTVALRPRANLEAVDLGVRMVQVWWRPLVTAWLPVYLALSIVLVASVGHGFESTWAFILAHWWLKPLFDVVLLHVFSRAVFGELADGRSTWRALPALLWRTGLWSTLLLRPIPWIWWFNTMRSTLLPVTQLEGLRGHTARERRGLLARQIGATAFGLTVLMFVLQPVMFFALIGLMFMLPESMLDLARSFLFDPSEESRFFSVYAKSALWIVVVGFLEPFYVAGGFALYRRRAPRPRRRPTTPMRPRAPRTPWRRCSSAPSSARVTVFGS